MRLGELFMRKSLSFLVILSAGLLLTDCVSSKEAVVIKRIKLNAENVDSFNVTTDLETTKSIHTDRQAEYLSYDGEYVSIPENLYPDGQQHLSDPNPVSLAWDFDVPSGKSILRYSVAIGREPDLSDAYVVNGTTEKSIGIYNSYLGDNYFKIIANYTDGTSDSSKIQKYQVEDVYPRNLKIDGMTNCRDMGGGRTLEDGGRIKQGMIYRTSGTHSWGNGRAVVPDTITSSGKEELLNHLRCKTEINVNNSGSNQVGVDNFVDAYMYYDAGKHHLYRNAEPLKTVFHALSDINNYPIFYHCRIGTDRTGLVAIMISGLLGVSENEIFQDYLFSNFGNIQEKRYIGEKAGRDNILRYIDDLKTYPGEKFQNKVYNCLLSIGVPAEELDSIIDILTEGNKASGNNNQQEVVLAEDFEAEDTEMKEITATSGNASRAHPKKYYTLGEDQSVTAYFNPQYTAKVALIAYLGSTDSSASKTIGDSISVNVDGSDFEVNERTFADVGFGSGEGRTYYSPVILGEMNMTPGQTEVKITGVANNLNIGALALIPVEPVSSSNEPNNKDRVRGCFGSITATVSLVSLVSVGVIGIMVSRRKKEE